MPSQLQRAATRSRPIARVALAVVFAALVLVRVPSLAQPPGGDQGLYAYAGDRILAGEVPYRDAWDQKPPGLHVAYAAMRALWPADGVVAAADLLLACVTAAGVWALGSRLAPGTAAGVWSAGLFLLLSNPALGRLGGVRTRAQGEVFIGALVTLALVALVKRGHAAGRSPRGALAPSVLGAMLAGVALGLAFLFKYNAGTYLLPAAVALLVVGNREAQWRARWPTLRAAGALAGGFVIVILLCLAYFAANGALGDLYHATVTYNVFYSGETYDSRLALLRYVFTFPVGQARLDSLWWMGGLGTAALLVAGLRTPRLLVVPAWVVAACLSIAINGGRGLPQYFVQASPALALAAGWLVAWLTPRLNVAGRMALLALLAFGVYRVSNFDKVVASAAWDTDYLLGRMTRSAYLAHFGQPASGDKYSALANEELAHWLASESRPDERVLVFGFSPYALVKAERASATRFYWSRPVIVEFLEGTPRYGPSGMLTELERHAPRVVALQRRDWDPDTLDSHAYFMSKPALASWLRGHYAEAGELGNYVLWRRR